MCNLFTIPSISSHPVTRSQPLPGHFFILPPDTSLNKTTELYALSATEVQQDISQSMLSDSSSLHKGPKYQKHCLLFSPKISTIMTTALGIGAVLGAMVWVIAVVCAPTTNMIFLFSLIYIAAFIIISILATLGLSLSNLYQEHIDKKNVTLFFQESYSYDKYKAKMQEVTEHGESEADTQVYQLKENHLQLHSTPLSYIQTLRVSLFGQVAHPDQETPWIPVRAT